MVAASSSRSSAATAGVTDPQVPAPTAGIEAGLMAGSGDAAPRSLEAGTSSPKTGDAARSAAGKAAPHDPVIRTYRGRARPVLCAVDLPAMIADDDLRGRITDLREFVKRWAVEPEHRAAMIADPPRRLRRYHRFTARRWDLARIAAVVHALCDRDEVPIPGWVRRHRARRPIGIIDDFDVNSNWGRAICADAPAACAYHNVWFGQTTIENITVHGIRFHGAKPEDITPHPIHLDT